MSYQFMMYLPGRIRSFIDIPQPVVPKIRLPGVSKSVQAKIVGICHLPAIPNLIKVRRTSFQSSSWAHPQLHTPGMSGKDRIKALLKLISKSADDALLEYEKTGHDVPSLDSTEPHPLDSMTDNIIMKKAIRLLEGACDQLCTTLAPPAHTILNVSCPALLP